MKMIGGMLISFAPAQVVVLGPYLQNFGYNKTWISKSMGAPIFV